MTMEENTKSYTCKHQVKIDIGDGRHTPQAIDSVFIGLLADETFTICGTIEILSVTTEYQFTSPFGKIATGLPHRET